MKRIKVVLTSVVLAFALVVASAQCNRVYAESGPQGEANKAKAKMPSGMTLVSMVVWIIATRV